MGGAAGFDLDGWCKGNPDALREAQSRTKVIADLRAQLEAERIPGLQALQAIIPEYACDLPLWLYVGLDEKAIDEYRNRSAAENALWALKEMFPEALAAAAEAAPKGGE